MKRKNSKKGLTSTIALLSSVSLVSVGFAAWVLTSGDERSFEAGNLKVDTVNDNSHTFENVSRIKGRVFTFDRANDHGTPDPSDDTIDKIPYDVLRNSNKQVNAETHVNESDVILTDVYTTEYVEEDDLQGVSEKLGGGWNVNYSANRRQVKDDDFDTDDIEYTDDDHDIKAEKAKAYSFYETSAKTAKSGGPETAAWDLEVTTSDGDLEDITFYFYVEITNVRGDEKPSDILGDIASNVLAITDNSTGGYDSAKTDGLVDTATVTYANFKYSDSAVAGTDYPKNDAENWYSDAQYVAPDSDDYMVDDGHGGQELDSDAYNAAVQAYNDNLEKAQSRAVIVKVSFPWGSVFDGKNPLDQLVDGLKTYVHNASELQTYVEKLHEDDVDPFTYNEQEFVGYRDKNDGESDEDYTTYKNGEIEKKLLDLNEPFDSANRSLAITTTQYFNILEDYLKDVTFKLTFTASAANAA